MYSVVSLFCGCGGLDLGFKRLGFEIVYACDNDPASIDCYVRNVESNALVRDVTTAPFHRDIGSIGKADVILGGFPCQGFSKSGPKNPNDPRNQLYIEMKKAVHALRPAIFIAENVDGISQNYRGQYLKTIYADFNSIGYQVDYEILNAAHYGVPQHRRRIFFVGLRKPIRAPFIWPEPTHNVETRNGEFEVAQPLPLFSEIKVPKPALTLKDAIGDLVELVPTIPDHRVVRDWPKKYERIFQSIRAGQKLCNVRFSPTSVYTWQIPEVFGHVSTLEKLLLETIGKHRRHKKYGDIPNGNPLSVEVIEDLSGAEGIRKVLEGLTKKRYVKCIDGKFDLKGAMFCSGLFKRPVWDEPSPTVLTNFSNPRYFIHPSENRPFSLRECARIQGFPDTFVFSTGESDRELRDGYRVVGNAVPPPLATTFARSVREYLVNSTSEAA